MIIFGVDSATRAGSAAVWQDGRLLAESYADVGLTHSETLMVLCDEVFRRAKLSPDEVDYYAVTSGPGSFTGLRIGMGTVKGLALATGKKCVAVSTLETLAWNVAPSDRTVVSVLDARRNRVYHAAFQVAEGFVNRQCEDGVVQVEALMAVHAGQRVVFIGDAAQMCYNTLRDSLDCVLPPIGNRLPRAAALCAAARHKIEQGAVLTAGQLKPDYIQIPQAERELKQRSKQP
jgi:tRNA threonylcarbamoyladenosine biosynthesis protein TsaB